MRLSGATFPPRRGIWIWGKMTPALITTLGARLRVIGGLPWKTAKRQRVIGRLRRATAPMRRATAPRRRRYAASGTARTRPSAQASRARIVRSAWRRTRSIPRTLETAAFENGHGVTLRSWAAVEAAYRELGAALEEWKTELIAASILVRATDFDDRSRDRAWRPDNTHNATVDVARVAPYPQPATTACVSMYTPLLWVGVRCGGALIPARASRRTLRAGCGPDRTRRPRVMLVIDRSGSYPGIGKRPASALWSLDRRGRYVYRSISPQIPIPTRPSPPRPLERAPLGMWDSGARAGEDWRPPRRSSRPAQDADKGGGTPPHDPCRGAETPPPSESRSLRE
jgi:hypothetical protein